MSDQTPKVMSLLPPSQASACRTRASVAPESGFRLTRHGKLPHAASCCRLGSRSQRPGSRCPAPPARGQRARPFCPCQLRAGGLSAVRGKAPLLICSGAASRGLPYGGSTRFYGGSTRWQGHLGRFTGLRLRCGDWRAAAGGCHRASLMMKRRAAATAVRPCPRPGPGSPPSSFPQVTCLDRSGRPVLPPLFACGMRARPALAVLAWSGDGSPVWGCTTTSGDQVPPRTHMTSF